MLIFGIDWKTLLSIIVAIFGVYYFFKYEMQLEKEKYPMSASYMLEMLKKNTFKLTKSERATNQTTYFFIAEPRPNDEMVQYKIEFVDGNKIEFITFSDLDHFATSIFYKNGIFVRIICSQVMSLAEGVVTNNVANAILNKARALVESNS